MALTIHDLSVPMFLRQLTAMRAILGKAQAFADSRKFDSRKFLDLKLSADMAPFAFQVRTACDMAKNGSARLAGVERPAFEDNEATLAELEARIDRTRAFLGTLRPEQMAGVESRDITFPVGGESMVLSGLDYLRAFVIPNFQFHATTAYVLLRSAGVDLSKRDFLGA